MKHSIYIVEMLAVLFFLGMGHSEITAQMLGDSPHTLPKDGSTASSEFEFHRLLVSAYPSALVPLNSESRIVNTGFGGFLGTEYRLENKPFLFGLVLSYSGAPISYSGIDTFEGNVTSLSGFAKTGVRIPLFPWLQLVGEGFLGAGYNSMDTGSNIYGRDSGLSPGYGAVVGFDFPFSKLFSFGIRGGYTAHLNTYGGILLQAGTTISFPKTTRRHRDSYQEEGPPPLLIEELRLNTVFPVFYKYYDNHALGTAILSNGGTVPVSDLSIRLLVPRFMDVSKTQSISKTLEPGEKENIDFFVLLNDEVLSITEGTKVALKIDVSFTADGRKHQYTMDRTLEMADRNAMTWDDDRKAASFVTAKDPAILTMARNVASVVRAEGYDAINLNLRTAIAIAEAVSLYGVNYVIDPTSPHAELAGSPQAVDFLQFPRQTLEYKAGDCDDLSILYSALLEAVGVPSAFMDKKHRRGRQPYFGL